MDPRSRRAAPRARSDRHSRADLPGCQGIVARTLVAVTSRTGIRLVDAGRATRCALAATIVSGFARAPSGAGDDHLALVDASCPRVRQAAHGAPGRQLLNSTLLATGHRRISAARPCQPGFTAVNVRRTPAGRSRAKRSNTRVARVRPSAHCRSPCSRSRTDPAATRITPSDHRQTAKRCQATTPPPRPLGATKQSTVCALQCARERATAERHDARLRAAPEQLTHRVVSPRCRTPRRCVGPRYDA